MSENDTGPAVAKRIAVILEKKRLKQKDLSDQTSIPQSTISNLMVGSIKEPYASTVYKIAKVLDVTVESLLEGIVTIEPPSAMDLSGIPHALAKKIATLVREHYAGEPSPQGPRRTGAPSSRRKKP